MIAAHEGRSIRYEVRWRDAFDEVVRPLLVANAAVLDVGSGRKPTIGPADRPLGCSYVGLDISERELQLAGDDAYDETIVADITTWNPALSARFDLVLSWQVLEHVRPLDRTFANIHSYLRPGGVVIAQLSGKFSAFGLVNQLVPSRLGVLALERLLGRDAESVYPAYYDRCYATALARILAGWSEVRIIPRFRGAGYFKFSRTAERLYLTYEDWAVRSGRENLATHYLLTARR